MLLLIRHLAFPTFLLLCSIDQRLTDQKCDTRLRNDALYSFEMLMKQFQFPALFQNAKQMRARISKYQLHVNQLTFALLTIYKTVPENPVVKVTQNGTRRFPSYQRNFLGATEHLKRLVVLLFQTEIRVPFLQHSLTA